MRSYSEIVVSISSVDFRRVYDALSSSAKFELNRAYIIRNRDHIHIYFGDEVPYPNCGDDLNEIFKEVRKYRHRFQRIGDRGQTGIENFGYGAEEFIDAPTPVTSFKDFKGNKTSINEIISRVTTW